MIAFCLRSDGPKIWPERQILSRWQKVVGAYILAVRKQSNGTRHAFPGHNATSSMALYLLVWPSPNKAITLWIHQVWYTDQIRTIWIQSLSNGSSATNHFFDKSILRILYHNSAQSSRIFQKQQIPADALTCFNAGSLLIYKTISLSV